MSTERIKISVTSADKAPRGHEARLAIGQIQIPVRDAIAAVVFLAVAAGGYVQLQGNCNNKPVEVDSVEIQKPSAPATDSYEYQKKHCDGTVSSDGGAHFICSPTPSNVIPPKRENNLNSPNSIDPFNQFDKKTNSRKRAV